MTPSPSPDFAVALRGYDRQQVDAHLADLQSQLDAAQERLSAARRENAELARRQSTSAPSLAGALFRRLEQEAGDLRQQAAQDAERIRAEAVARARAVQTAAEEQALGLVDEARAEAARLRAETVDLTGEREQALRRARVEAEALLRRSADHAHERAEAVVQAAEEEAAALLEQARARARELEEESRSVQERLATTNAAVSRLVRTLEDALAQRPEDAPTEVLQLSKAHREVAAELEAYADLAGPTGDDAERTAGTPRVGATG